jgi:putative membrane protein
MRPSIGRRTSAASASAGAVLIVGAIIILSHELGPQARHMALHIATMNIAAPLLAALIVARRTVNAQPGLLWLAALVQVVALWAAHAPAIQHHAMTGAGVQLATHGILMLAALAFWTLLLALPDERRWHAIPPLLLTGKLVCLLAVLMVFAPRALYGVHDHGSAALTDQQLAGLLMLAACPLSYLVVATILTIALVRDAPVRTA